MVEHAVLRLDVSVENTSLMEVHHSQQRLGEVVAGQGLREYADTAHTEGIFQEWVMIMPTKVQYNCPSRTQQISKYLWRAMSI